MKHIPSYVDNHCLRTARKNKKLISCLELAIAQTKAPNRDFVYGWLHVTGKRICVYFHIQCDWTLCKMLGKLSPLL